MIRITCLAILCVLFWSYTALAQVTTATISGVVHDETGAVLPGVTVTLKHVDTGATRTLVTDDKGSYRAPNLSLGSYQLEATLIGFQTEARRGIDLTIGRAAVVDFALKLGDITESVLVTSEAPLVETSSSSVAGLITAQAIRDLPLSGRDFVQLALLEPSVMRVSNTDGTVVKGFGTRTTFAGSRPRQNTFLMDGTNVNNMTNFGVPGSVAGVILGVDTVREFQVLVGSYSAEYAGAGGTLNAVTKSGTNEPHGTAFWLTRNDAMDSKNFFDRSEPEFSRNQFGFTAGGPIRTDRLFFFGSYEGLRDKLGVTQRGVVPDENARRGLLPDARNPGQLLNVGVHPNIRPYLDLNPMPNGKNFGDGTAEYVFSQTEPTTQNYFVGKLDYRYGPSNSIFGRYTFDDSNALKTLSLPVFESKLVNRNQWLTAENRTMLSDRTFFLLRFGSTRSYNLGDDIVARGQTFDDKLALIPGKPMGSVSYTPSRGSNTPAWADTNTLQYSGQVVLERGTHSWKLGGDLIQYFYKWTSVTNLAGVYQFTSLTNFLQNRPSRLTIRINDNSPTESRDVRMLVGGLYVQDDMRLSDRFTLNAGVRYEPYGVPREANGLESTLKHPLDPAYTQGGRVIRNASWRNFGPRVGFAWDLMGNGRMALRGGAGVYHDILLPSLYRGAYAGSPPYSLIYQIDNPRAFPNALEDLKAPGPLPLVNPDGINYDVTQPRIYQYNLQLETQLSSTLVVNVGYVGSRGQGLVRILDGNTAVADILPDGSKFIPVGRPRRNPNFAGSWWRFTDAQSFYDGFRAKVNKRFSDGLMFGVAYTLGRAVDDSSTDVGQTDFQSNVSLPQDPDDRLEHRGLANFDVRQNLVMNFSANFPWARERSGVAGGLLGGWQLSGIVSLVGGSPFSPVLSFDNARNRSRAFSQRPSLNPAYSNNPVLGGPDKYFDPMAFDLPPAGTYGNLGRNTISAPGLALVDLSLMKNLAIGANRRLEFRAEAFNLLNRANFGRPASAVFDARGRVGNAGRITTTSTPARQIQFGVKFIF